MADFLYNGVQLPDINEVWTGELKQTYPYATIICPIGTTDYSNKSLLRVHDLPRQENMSYGEKVEPHNSVEYKIDTTSKSWVYSRSYSNSTSNGISQLIWVSHDVFYTDGTLCMPKSPEPVPVGGGAEIDPRAFMAGCRMGQIVRAMRL